MVVVAGETMAASEVQVQGETLLPRAAVRSGQLMTAMFMMRSVWVGGEESVLVLRFVQDRFNRRFFQVEAAS